MEVNTLKHLHFPLVIILLLCMTMLTQAIEWDNSKFMALDEVKQGMQGKVKTVFSGTKVEEFNFEVISIEKNYWPQFDVIWARGWGGSFDETGIASGMSGSPAYINGRLIGAISLGYPYQKKGDFFGITSIESMLNVAQRGMKPNLNYYSSSGGFSGIQNSEEEARWQDGEEAKWQDGKMARWQNGNSPLAPLPPCSSRGTGSRESGLAFLNSEFPIPHSEVPYAEQKLSVEYDAINPVFDSPIMRPQIPIAFSGLSTRAIDYIKPILDKYGMYPVQGSGGGSIDVDVPIEPGQALGIEFARGDFSVFASGTITYVEGDQILGFGHLMFGEGNVNLPLSVGYIQYVLPLMTRSTKMPLPVKPIGTLVQDRLAGIAGIIGSHPNYIPVDLHVKTADGISKELHYEVIRHRGFSAGITVMGILSLIDAVDKSSGDSTANVHTVISLKDQPDIVKDDFFSSSGGAVSAPVQSLYPLYSIIGNPFEKVEVEKIAVDISIEDKRNTAQIEGVRINKSQYKPGDEIQMFISLRPYLEQPIVQKATVTIPKDMPDGMAVLLVSSVSANESWQQNRAPLNFQPTNIQQLIKLLQRGESRNNIIIEIFVPKVGMTVQGEEMPELPLSMLSVMTYTTQAGMDGFTRGATLLREKLPTEYFISGGATLRLIVDRNAP
jgi:hypothetical protein